MLYSRDDLNNKDDGTKKEGLFSAFFRFLKEKTGKSKGGKSKRKQKPQLQRKRQRTISAMSNLDPIQESPDEDDYVDDDDNDSYTHDSSSLSESEPNSENVSICEADISKKEDSEPWRTLRDFRFYNVPTRDLPQVIKLRGRGESTPYDRAKSDQTTRGDRNNGHSLEEFKFTRGINFLMKCWKN